MPAKDAVIITPYRDGPLLVRGPVQLTWPDGSPIDHRHDPVALCRCGKSKLRPFCDGTHTRAGFKDAGFLPHNAPQETLSPGRVTIIPTPDGPFECRGPLIILGADGRSAASEAMWLCRCGHSRTKPFCDGSHKRVGFRT